MKKGEFKTSHKLKFEVAPWERNPAFMLFKVGTCHGQWMSTELAYCIVSIMNEQPGNGHLEDVFEWFENSCKRDKKALMILEFFNDKFKDHCINKREFIQVPGRNDLIKIF